jgi:hypothetical protein
LSFFPSCVGGTFVHLGLLQFLPSSRLLSLLTLTV